jgi:hypothetical protein
MGYLPPFTVDAGYKGFDVSAFMFFEAQRPGSAALRRAGSAAAGCSPPALPFISAKAR